MSPYPWQACFQLLWHHYHWPHGLCGYRKWAVQHPRFRGENFCNMGLLKSSEVAGVCEMWALEPECRGIGKHGGRGERKTLPASGPRLLTGCHCERMEQRCWWCPLFLRKYWEVLPFPTGDGQTVSPWGARLTLSYICPHPILLLGRKSAMESECQVSGVS